MATITGLPRVPKPFRTDLIATQSIGFFVLGPIIKDAVIVESNRADRVWRGQCFNVERRFFKPQSSNVNHSAIRERDNGFIGTRVNEYQGCDLLGAGHQEAGDKEQACKKNPHR